MLNVCYICLRNVQNYVPINEELANFYENLCNYKNEKDYLFCPICINNLQMCYAMKIKCMLATDQLQALKLKYETNTQDDEPLVTETVEVCTHTVEIDDKKRKRKYNSAKKNTSKNKDNTQAKKHGKRLKNNIQEHIDDLEHDNSEESVLKTDIKQEIFLEHDYAQSDHHEKDTQKVIVKKDTQRVTARKDTQRVIVKKDTQRVRNDLAQVQEMKEALVNDIKEEVIVLNDIVKLNFVESSPVGSDVDFSDEENFESDCEDQKETVWLSMAKIDTAKNLCKNTRFLEDLKSKLKSKFECHGKVIDRKGIFIEPNVILNNLDKLCDRNLNNLQRIALESGPFKTGHIERLAVLHDRFKYDTMFHIKYLTDEKQMKEEFEKRKTFQDYINGVHNCEKCYMGFKNATSLENHMKNSHNESFKFACRICQCRFKMFHNLRRHVLCYHSNVYQCKLCPDYIVHYRGYMTQHFLKHKGRVSTCMICHKEYRCVSAFYLHMNTAHRSSSDHICRLCACTFHRAVGLNSHLKRKHMGEEFKVSPDNVKCDECEITFLNNDVYKRHQYLTHRSNVVREVTVQTRAKRIVTTKEYACDLCNKTGLYPLWLYKHYISDHPDVPYPTTVTDGRRQHLCEECGKNFTSRALLNEHKNYHTGNKPYACSKCPQRFFRKYNLKIHLERHEPPKRQCQYCGKKFGSQANLYLHTRIHKGDRRYKCEICDKGFTIKRNLEEHIKGVHCNIKRQKRRPTGPKMRLYEKYPMNETQNLEQAD